MFRYHTATDSRAFGMDAAGRLVRQAPQERGVVAEGRGGVAVARRTLPELLDALGVSRSVMFAGEVECAGAVALSDAEWEAALSS